MKVFGAVFISFAGFLGGLTAARRQRETLRRCVVLCRMLELMAFELSRFRTPLPDLFSRLAEQLEEPAAGLCGAAANFLEEGTGFAEAWMRCISDLSRSEREELAPLARILGRYGAEEQTGALEACRRAMDNRCDSLRAELKERSRVYIGVGAAGGVMLAVMLL